MSTEASYELIVIGAGPAGESAALLAAAFGHSVAVVERAAPGGTVTTTGGGPTKTLRDAALALTGFHLRPIYGLSVTPADETTLQQIRERTRAVSATLQQATRAKIVSAGIDYLEGTAHLGSRHSVVVTSSGGGPEQVLQAGTIVLATGSRPFRPASVPFEDPDVFDSDEIFAMRRGRLPRDLLIVGGGPIGVEFATVFAGGGVAVTLMHQGERLVPAMDGEIAELLAATLARLGVRVLPNQRPTRIARVGERLVVDREGGDPLIAETVLYAVGRSVNTEGLGLDAAGVATGRRGVIVVDDRMRTSVSGIYAAGDVVGPTLASIAMEQGRVAVCDAFDIALKDQVHPLPVSAVYGMPEIAGAGLTEEECLKKGLAYEVGRCRFDQIPRGVISGQTDGLLKLIFRPDDRTLLGVHVISDVASELVGMGQAVMHYGGTIDAFIDLTLNTPTYTMAYKVAAVDGLLHLARSRGPAFVTSLRSSR